MEGLNPETIEALKSAVLEIAGLYSVPFFVLLVLWIMGRNGAFAGEGRGRAWLFLVGGLLVGYGANWLWHFGIH